MLKLLLSAVLVSLALGQRGGRPQGGEPQGGGPQGGGPQSQQVQVVPNVVVVPSIPTTPRPQFPPFPPFNPPQMGVPCGLSCSRRFSGNTPINNFEFFEDFFGCGGRRVSDDRCHSCCIAYANRQGISFNNAVGFTTDRGCHCCVANFRC